nr:hypothetical protein Iba_chr11aCG14010 [Ipomoea batatas]GMD54414.1 hypothetical protein Iba_chr11cCG11890 [Ipomoea batatas]
MLRQTLPDERLRWRKDSALHDGATAASYRTFLNIIITSVGKSSMKVRVQSRSCNRLFLTDLTGTKRRKTEFPVTALLDFRCPWAKFPPERKTN